MFILPTPALKLGALATFLIFLAFGYFLIQYTYREEAPREQAEKLAQRMVDIGLGQRLVYCSHLGPRLIFFKHFQGLTIELKFFNNKYKILLF